MPTFGELRGLSGLRPGRPLELIPYLLSEGQFADNQANPFRTSRELRVNAGLDARYRITSNLTLAATANPDFGQVEVDGVYRRDRLPPRVRRPDLEPHRVRGRKPRHGH